MPESGYDVVDFNRFTFELGSVESRVIDIYQAFEEAHLTVDDLASQTGVPRERVEAILTGRWLPSQADRDALAKALGHNASEITWGHTMDPRNVRYRRFGLPEDFG